MSIKKKKRFRKYIKKKVWKRERERERKRKLKEEISKDKVREREREREKERIKDRDIIKDKGRKKERKREKELTCHSSGRFFDVTWNTFLPFHELCKNISKEMFKVFVQFFLCTKLSKWEYSAFKSLRFVRKRFEACKHFTPKRDANPWPEANLIKPLRSTLTFLEL